jgi:hypothetical protein
MAFSLDKAKILHSDVCTFFTQSVQNPIFRDTVEETTKITVNRMYGVVSTALAVLTAYAYKQLQHRYGAVALGIAAVGILVLGIRQEIVQTPEYTELERKINSIFSGLHKMSELKSEFIVAEYNKTDQKYGSTEEAQNAIRALSEEYEDQTKLAQDEDKIRSSLRDMHFQISKALIGYSSSFNNFSSIELEKLEDNKFFHPSYKEACLRVFPAVRQFLYGASDKIDKAHPPTYVHLIRDGGPSVYPYFVECNVERPEQTTAGDNSFFIPE